MAPSERCPDTGEVVEAGERFWVDERRVPLPENRESRSESARSAACATVCSEFDRLRLDLYADLLEPAFVGELRQRGDGFEPDVFLFARQHGQHSVDDLVVTEAAERTHDHRQRFRWRGNEHFDEPRHRALAADFGERIDGAFADPPVLVFGRLDEVTDGAIVFGLIEDLDRRAADVLVLIAHQLKHGFDDSRPADLAERIRGAAAHPPVVIGNRFEKLLDRLGVADFVEHFHRGAAGVLVLVLEHRDQVLDRIRIVGADDDVDGLVLHVDFRIAQQRADLFDFDRSVHLGERAQRGGPHQLVGVLELLL